MRVVRKSIPVIELDSNGNQFEITGHNARVGGQMGDGTATWEFDEMDDNGFYIAFRGQDNRLYLVRQ